jgi:hypothetical protein
MRIACIILAATACLAGPAAAESGGSPFEDVMKLNQLATRGPLTQWAATVPTQSGRLSGPARQWIKAEVQRQAESPRSVTEVALAVDEALGAEIARMAKDERAHPEDVGGALILKVFQDTKIALMLAARKAPRKDRDAWQARIDQAEANRREAFAMLTQGGVELAAN